MTITIIGRRWFQRTYGNTYHTVSVHADGATWQSERQYGYGDSYLQTAQEWLTGYVQRNYPELPAPTYPLSIWAQENGVTLHVECLDVPRQKEL